MRSCVSCPRHSCFCFITNQTIMKPVTDVPTWFKDYLTGSEDVLHTIDNRAALIKAGWDALLFTSEKMAWFVYVDARFHLLALVIALERYEDVIEESEQTWARSYLAAYDIANQHVFNAWLAGVPIM